MKTENYLQQQQRLPKTGKQLIAHQQDDVTIVFQAFNKQIANYAVANQRFGGPAYSFTRMSWIKPGFMWMMHRAGWATKENQECILAISIKKEHLKLILAQATLTAFDAAYYDNTEQWKKQLNETDVRLQWDPDHDPYGNKLERKAMQVGMKGRVLKQFNEEWIVKIENITSFVQEAYESVLKKQLEQLQVPEENIVELNDQELEKKLGIEK